MAFSVTPRRWRIAGLCATVGLAMFVTGDHPRRRGGRCRAVFDLRGSQSRRTQILRGLRLCVDNSLRELRFCERGERTVFPRLPPPPCPSRLFKPHPPTTPPT